MTDKIKAGVFGVGSLGQWHARIYAEMPSAELTGVYDPDPTQARAIAERYGTKAYDNMDALAEDIDAASVAAPTDRHFEVFSRLAARDCHMLMEKPIAATMEHAREMVAEADRRNLVLQVGHVERFNPVVAFLESNLNAPRYIEAERLAPFPPSRPGALPRGTEVSVVLDLMIHDLDVILHLVNAPVKSLHAFGMPWLSATEDFVNARLTFENGCVASITASRISPTRARRLRVFEEERCFSLDYMNQSAELSRKSGDTMETAPVPIEKGDALERQLAAFIDSVRGQTPPVVSGRHAAEALELGLRICTAIRNQPS